MTSPLGVPLQRVEAAMVIAHHEEVVGDADASAGALAGEGADLGELKSATPENLEHVLLVACEEEKAIGADCHPRCLLLRNAHPGDNRGVLASKFCCVQEAFGIREEHEMGALFTSTIANKSNPRLGSIYFEREKEREREAHGRVTRSVT